jgi:6-phosphogluconate dehydrogenase
LRIWSGGCIIRSTLLSILKNGWKDHQSDILQHAYARQLIQINFSKIKETISTLALSSQAYPVISSSLEYFKYLTSARSSAYIIQAQRDYFGAHTYKKINDPSGASYHTKWH